MPFTQLTPAVAADALMLVGLRVAPEAVAVEARRERWMVRLPDQRLAWFAASESGRRRLVAERRVLRLLEARCGFGAPRVLREGFALSVVPTTTICPPPTAILDTTV